MTSDQIRQVILEILERIAPDEDVSHSDSGRGLFEPEHDGRDRAVSSASVEGCSSRGLRLMTATKYRKTRPNRARPFQRAGLFVQRG